MDIPSRASDPPPVVMHIGMPKAASTTLQNALFACHTQVYYLGKAKSRSGGYSSPEVESLITQLSRPLTTKELSRMRRDFQDEVARASTPEQIPVLSREGLCHGGSRTQERLAQNAFEIFGRARVMIVLRNPFNLIPSLYLQRLRGNNARQSRRADHMVGYFTLDEWLTSESERQRHAPFKLLQVADNLAPHIARFGRDQIGVFLFEDLLEHQDSFTRSVARFLGVDEDEASMLAAAAHANPRMTEAHVARLQRLNNRPRINQRPATGIDQHHAILHLAQGRSINEMVRGWALWQHGEPQRALVEMEQVRDIRATLLKWRVVFFPSWMECDRFG